MEIDSKWRAWILFSGRLLADLSPKYAKRKDWRVRQKETQYLLHMSRTDATLYVHICMRVCMNADMKTR